MNPAFVSVSFSSLNTSFLKICGHDPGNMVTQGDKISLDSGIVLISSL